MKVEDVFKRVRVTVEKATNGQQTPWESSSLRGDFYFVAQAKEPPPRTVAKTAASELTVSQTAARAYEAAERIHTISSYRLVVERFPGTVYAGLAREQIGKIESASPPRASAEEVEASLGLKREARKRIQTGLWALGFNPGSPDGLFGKRTRETIRKWQTSRGEQATGYLKTESVKTLLAAVPDLSGPIWLTAQNQPCKVWNPYPKAGETLTWSGACVEGKASGRGRQVWRSSNEESVYEGELRNGKHHGRGTITYANGHTYEGEWRNDKRHGRGIKTWPNGNRYEGEWEDNKPHGWGTHTKRDGDAHKGNWNNGCFLAGDVWWAINTTKKACGFDVKMSLKKVSLIRSTYGDEATDWNVSPTTALRTKSIGANTPTTHALADTITTKALHELIIKSLPPAVLIDVLGDEGHRTLPGALWLKGAGLTDDETNIEGRLVAILDEITEGDKARALVFFCRGAQCWLSYNAALRATTFGYENVYWYRGGITAWETAKLPTERAVRTPW